MPPGISSDGRGAGVVEGSMRIGSTSERYRPGPVPGQGGWLPSGELHALSPGQTRPLCGREKPLVVREATWPPPAEGLGERCPACSQLAALERSSSRRPVLPQLRRALGAPVRRARFAALIDVRAR